MNEGETSIDVNDPPPKKSDRTLLLVLIAVALAFVALIALNMK